MSTLHLPVKGEYFRAIKDGTKKFEYRLQNEHWTKRLVGRSYDEIKIKLGYPKKDDTSRIMTFPYKGFEKQTITHPHFGEEPVEVFAILLS